ncbi:MAG: 1-acyl-sn-glycerol-3-phosphate acyltransferase [Anaerolineales bacterium]|nr:1-acyl-sn-glycerol-3-phosphate acyltransferase [Anaerolineales bacterium]NUQ83782.1 1-acyl-sn-glycerol-3-phosphate acyltransferase [Anaerolineales bacterium]
MPSQLDILTQINLDDLVASFGWQGYPLLASALRRVFAKPARKFAEQMVNFDQAVGESNLAEASRRIMRSHYVKDVRVHGGEHAPAAGPALFLSNHPGMADTISLFAAINRADLKIIALHRPFLESLTNTTKQLFFIDNDPAKRMNAVRQVSAYLKSGGSVLTFPAGEIEPDPGVHPGALDSLKNWTDSAGVFIRFARETRIVPVLVSGVIWEKTARHWLTRLKRTRKESEKLAAALQLLVIILRDARPNTVHVRFARPVTLDEVGSTDALAIHQVVIQRLRGLIKTQPPDQGVSVV